MATVHWKLQSNNCHYSTINLSHLVQQDGDTSKSVLGWSTVSILRTITTDVHNMSSVSTVKLFVPIKAEFKIKVFKLVSVLMLCCPQTASWHCWCWSGPSSTVARWWLHIVLRSIYLILLQLVVATHEALLTEASVTHPCDHRARILRGTHH